MKQQLGLINSNDGSVIIFNGINEYLDFTLDYRDEETIHDDTLVYVDYGIPLDECNRVDMDTWQATFGASLRHHNDIMARNG
tara:strand:- start:1227 stop:1472 length:246 start_codon:yes stop_codon:yes gene_type:complete